MFTKILENFLILSWIHWGEIAIISAIFALILIQNKYKKDNSITSYCLILASVVAASCYYVSMLIILNPNNSLTLALSEDILCVPIDNIAVTLRQMFFGEHFDPTYKSLEIQMDAALWKLHWLFLQLILAQVVLFMIIKTTRNPWIHVGFIILLCYYWIYPNIYCILNSVLIMNNNVWLPNGSINMSFLDKMEFNIGDGKTKVCRLYTQEEAFRLIEHYINVGIKEILNKYRDSEVPKGFQEYIGSFLMSHLRNKVQNTLHNKIEVNSLKGFISYGMELTQAVLAKHKIGSAIRAFLKREQNKSKEQKKTWFWQ